MSSSGHLTLCIKCPSIFKWIIQKKNKIQENRTKFKEVSYIYTQSRRVQLNFLKTKLKLREIPDGNLIGMASEAAGTSVIARIVVGVATVVVFIAVVLPVADDRPGFLRQT